MHRIRVAAIGRAGFPVPERNRIRDRFRLARTRHPSPPGDAGVADASRRVIGLIDPRLRPFVERIWNYHRLDHELVSSDAILVLCSHDTSVAEYAAQLFLDTWAPLLIFSGGLGRSEERRVGKEGRCWR